MNKKTIIFTGIMTLSAWIVAIAQSSQNKPGQSQQNYTETEIAKLRLYKKGEIVWEHLGFTEKSVIESEISKYL